MPIIKKIILDIENPTRNQIKKAFNIHRQNQRLASSLISPTGHPIKPCGGCGKHYDNTKSAIYYGEQFCSDCVEKWLHGEK